MAGTIDQRLEELGIELPAASAPLANYVPYVVTGNLVFISGQGPVGKKGLEFVGKVGSDLTLDQGKEAARLTALNLVAQVKAACGGDLDKVTRCVKLGGFVNCVPEFHHHPEVINGASDVLVEIFGDKGRHARFALGTVSLPFDMAVEIDAVFEIAP